MKEQHRQNRRGRLAPSANKNIPFISQSLQCLFFGW